ncbi:MAG: hypothetical protein O7D30_09515 [Rickettsia endosymbiont of Ixodes persulcatus]|nr:hypothetical protein [Rickettsia endosymbiont of Ixodes persulcatus]
MQSLLAEYVTGCNDDTWNSRHVSQLTKKMLEYVIAVHILHAALASFEDLTQRTFSKMVIAAISRRPMKTSRTETLLPTRYYDLTLVRFQHHQHTNKEKPRAPTKWVGSGQVDLSVHMHILFTKPANRTL